MELETKTGMRALIIDEEDGDIFAVCPHCRFVTNNVEVDDYVGDNCLMWCNNCGEILFCITGDNGSGDVNKLAQLAAEQSCVIRLTREEALQYVNETDLDKAVTGKKPNNEKLSYYLTGVLNITHMISSAALSDDDTNMMDDLTDAQTLEKIREHYHDVNVTRFKDIPTEIDTAHDGIYLYYRGYCSHCGKQYENKIWGD
jgi:hypothetical protein